MNIGMIGLGRMGEALAYRLVRAGFSVVGFDPQEAARTAFKKEGGAIAVSIEEVARQADVVWLMVPAGKPVDEVIAQLQPSLKKSAIIIDGGNSHFTDSMRRARELAKHGIPFLDCGTSGGLGGRELGFSLMIGGDKKIVEQLDALFKALAAPEGYGYMGPSGAGHYVKMVHNGIEYALLQAYGEGFNLLKNNQQFPQLDLAEISRVWCHGSVIRSWILELAHEVFEEDQQLAHVSGKIGGGSTGRWTIQEAAEQGIELPLIEHALEIRDESHKTGGDYATKVVACLRNKFGGHTVEKL